jgi:dienelactone hydrolase
MMARMRVEDIEYTVDGIGMIGHLAVDDTRSGKRPGVLVCHEGPGLDEHAKGKAERLAGLGYIAFALDYHGGGRPLPREEMMARLGPLMSQPDVTVGRGQAGLDILLAQPETDATRLAGIGFCFGGTMVLEMARAGVDFKAVVGFHAGLGTTRPAAPGAVKGAVLACIGADDPLVPREQRIAFQDEMAAAGADWRLYLYGGAVHSFTNTEAGLSGMNGVAYHRPTDERSWRVMLDVFDETLGAPAG